MFDRTYDDDPGFDRLLFASPSLVIGSFRAAPEHPRFADSGPTRNHLFVFPRTTVSIEHEGGRAFIAGPPFVTLYNRGQRYRRGRVTCDGDRCEWFALAPELLLDIVAAVDPTVVERPTAPFRVTHGPSDPRLYLCQRRLVDRLRSATPPEPLETEEIVLGLARGVAGAIELARGDGGDERALPGRASHRRDLAASAMQLLAERFREPLGIAELARRLDCSPFHLCRVFHHETGWSLHRCREALRLRAALEELPDRSGDLTALALDLGYSSHSHFTAAFRRAFALTPSEWTRSAGREDRRRATRGAALRSGRARRHAGATLKS